MITDKKRPAKAATEAGQKITLSSNYNPLPALFKRFIVMLAAREIISKDRAVWLLFQWRLTHD
ncbi:hypothetical protein NB640_08410 [Oxalobacter vibrioformis]|uniref:Uncharacterized protein n=1 Tax=Oxalobacter vibrioformis TaxID=933080 RepID=A0A9E9P2J4_9BURK|nr:hypothetical protein [Oxalobacter vibrioformis]WAW09285.1 hypothetical protein NB640_08410 [Oxalobacter vibrioformis]